MLKKAAVIAGLWLVGAGISLALTDGQYYGGGWIAIPLVVGLWWLNRRRERNTIKRQMLAMDAALRSARATKARQDDESTAGLAFDWEVQRRFGLTRYHTELLTPDDQRYLEEFWSDPDLPSRKAGLYITDLADFGPEKIGAPPRQKHFFIPWNELMHAQLPAKQ